MGAAMLYKEELDLPDITEKASVAMEAIGQDLAHGPDGFVRLGSASLLTRFCTRHYWEGDYPDLQGQGEDIDDAVINLAHVLQGGQPRILFSGNFQVTSMLDRAIGAGADIKYQRETGKFKARIHRIPRRIEALGGTSVQAMQSALALYRQQAA
jgi:hypothetical protein